MIGSEHDRGPVLHGRRKTRPLRPTRRRLVEQLLPQLQINPAAPDFEPVSCFDFRPEQLWLEIGFGAGEHLAWQAAHNQTVGVIGAEPFINGVARLLAEIEQTGLKNVRIYPDDARTLINALPAASFDKCFLLFPDPWPKRRHHKRRFVRPDTLDALARILRPGAELRMATDHRGYGRWMLAHCLRHPAFEWPAECAADWRLRGADWPPTRYEAKSRDAGRDAVYYRFRRTGENQAGAQSP
jgi:tRNA (guanine-N7-)-methyltransferase